jgi:transposase
MAMELSAGTWVLLFSIGTLRSRQVRVHAGDLAGVVRAISSSKEKFGLPEDAAVVSCYEAGRDGFWIHRWLCSINVDNRVVDPASIEVTQRAKRVKTDRVDAQKLLRLLVRSFGGERDVWRELHVPSREHEDDRRLHREHERLLKERTALSNRVCSLLALEGLHLELGRHFEQEVRQLRCWNNEPLPANLTAELCRMARRWLVLDEQSRELDKHCNGLLARGEGRTMQVAQQLMQMRGIGAKSSNLLASELFAWREFDNRRQLGSIAGLAPTPYSSGSSEREQGISGAGNRRVRTTLIELAWMWLRLQPGSDLTAWFQKRFGHSGKRSRRVGIVALARRLLVALWRYLHDGVIPAGATLKPHAARA